tara:strand:- start:371 stop:730 length:360 start_codon:yes stop_codon:yes gene_type:complete
MAEKAPAPTGGGVRVREGDSMPASANTVAQLALETALNARETAEAQAEAQAAQLREVIEEAAERDRELSLFASIAGLDDRSDHELDWAIDKTPVKAVIEAQALANAKLDLIEKQVRESE